jgi:hypothetical protein
MVSGTSDWMPPRAGAVPVDALNFGLSDDPSSLHNRKKEMVEKFLLL